MIFLVCTFLLAVLPHEMVLKEQVDALSMKLELREGSNVFASVQRSGRSVVPAYEIRDADEKRIAIAQISVRKEGPRFELRNTDGELIASLKAKQHALSREYRINDSKGAPDIVAFHNAVGTEVTIVDAATDNVVAMLEAPLCTLQKGWSVTLIEPKFFDSPARLSSLMMIAAWQVDRSYIRHVSEAK